MCESHRNIAGVAVAERTPVKTIKISEEDKARAAGDEIAGLIHKFGFENVQKALKQQDPNRAK